MKKMDYRNARNFINVSGKEVPFSRDRATADDIRRSAGIKKGRRIVVEGRNGDMMPMVEGKVYVIPKGSKYKDTPAPRKASDDNKGILLLDYDNFKEACDIADVELDCEGIREFVESLNKGVSFTSYVYLGVNPKKEHIRDREIDSLWKDKFIVRTVKMVGQGIYMFSDVSQAITLDALRCVYENNVNKVVIVSNGERLADLVVLLREKGVNVDVVYFGSLNNYDLSVKASGFVDLESFISDEMECDEEKEECE